jgi:plasmid stabilization system protein ParE
VNIVWAQRANKQVVATLADIAEAGYPDYTRKLAQAITEETTKLLRFPDQCRIVANKFGFAYRKMVILRRYLIFYRVDGEAVRIVAFLDGRNQPGIDDFLNQA